MKSIFHDLMQFYKRLDALLAPSTRDCGICGKCCKAASKLRVHPLEMENIKNYVNNSQKFDKFRKFTNNEAVYIWGNTTGYCPFQEGGLCGIYPARPYTCRVYGHYDHLGKSLLDDCVYRGHAIPYMRREELPLIEEFDHLGDAFINKGCEVSTD